MNISEGVYTFIHYGYDDNLVPSLTLQPDNSKTFTHLEPRGSVLTLSFNTTARYCNGWHNLASAQSFPCPDSAQVTAEYNQCIHCKRKTGFNPAFYNASSVSDQQQARNRQPHFLYLAHFGPGVVKVGISWSQRGIRRLLDQGARSCLIIKDYPNATVARQYEAKIATLDGIAETLQHKIKHRLLTIPYNATNGVQELLHARQRLVAEFGIQADNNQPQMLDHFYLSTHTFIPHQLVHLPGDTISGKNLGLIGSSYIAYQDSTPYFLHLSPLLGYKVAITHTEQPNAHAPQQTSLF